jgi:hypothetical protein
VPEDVGLDFLRFVDGEKCQARTALRQFTAVTDLPAGLRIERRAVEYHHAILARGERVALGLPSGSYAQRVQAEYLKEVGERVAAGYGGGE